MGYVENKPSELDEYARSLMVLISKRKRKAERLEEELRNLRRQLKATLKEVSKYRYLPRALKHEAILSQMVDDRLSGD